MSRVLLACKRRKYDAIVLRVSESSASEWDSKLDQSGSTSPYNNAGWALVKKLDGWRSIRTELRDGTALTQVLIRTRPGLTVAYCPGGFVGSAAIDAESFTEFISQEIGGKVVYSRINMLSAVRDVHEPLVASGWKVATASLAAHESLQLQLDLPESARREKLSTNWGRNLRRAEKHDNLTEVAVRPSAAEIVKMHMELMQLKGGVVPGWVVSEEQVQSFLDGFQGRFVMVRCIGSDGAIRAIRGAVITGTTAYDMLAASTMVGRKHYSSHHAFWVLANELARRGSTRYDLGGIDAITNRGVYDFKQGTGAELIRYRGEFECARPLIFRSVIGRIVALRRVM